ncbi:MAG: hypothetical protein GWN01_02285 [Nitrosopumilaceae archaeon]|nr:hypothetical protein [Nitrosopumilaceae archaeon]NIU88706.1 hypothetical protein [Nitrosopumilaceae archaeon]NIX60403.1 hypothetical protein [Nitrosopumilaceae archaeon]
MRYRVKRIDKEGPNRMYRAVVEYTPSWWKFWDRKVVEDVLCKDKYMVYWRSMNTGEYSSVSLTIKLNDLLFLVYEAKTYDCDLNRRASGPDDFGFI